VINIELLWSPPCLACACWPMTSVLREVFRDLRTRDESSVALTIAVRRRGARSQAMNSRFACGRTSAAYWTDEPLVRALGRTSLIGVLYVCTLLDGPLLFLLGTPGSSTHLRFPYRSFGWYPKCKQRTLLSIDVAINNPTQPIFSPRTCWPNGKAPDYGSGDSGVSRLRHTLA
jgi:hypothetical protein